MTDKDIKTFKIIEKILNLPSNKPLLDGDYDIGKFFQFIKDNFSSIENNVDGLYLDINIVNDCIELLTHQNYFILQRELKIKSILEE